MYRTRNGRQREFTSALAKHIRLFCHTDGTSRWLNLTGQWNSLLAKGAWIIDSDHALWYWPHVWIIVRCMENFYVDKKTAPNVLSLMVNIHRPHINLRFTPYRSKRAVSIIICGRWLLNISESTLGAVSCQHSKINTANKCPFTLDLSCGCSLLASMRVWSKCTLSQRSVFPSILWFGEKGQKLCCFVAIADFF